MSECGHDDRFGGVFDLPKSCKACLACFVEQQAAEIERLKRDWDERNRLVELLRNRINELRDDGFKQQAAEIERLRELSRKRVALSETAIDRLASRVDVLKAQNAQQAAEIERLKAFAKEVCDYFDSIDCECDPSVGLTCDACHICRRALRLLKESEASGE